MILISHRGNINGPTDLENKPSYIDKALINYNVEVDVWKENFKWYLGHSKPQYKISIDYLKNDKLWCHAKNVEALIDMLKENIHCFWHENDKYTVTSRGFVWSHYKQKFKTNRYFYIQVLPEICSNPINNCNGICSDYINFYENIYNCRSGIKS